MAKKPADDDKPGKSEDAPGHNKPEPKLGGSEGNPGQIPVNPDDYVTTQERAAEGAEPGTDPKTPYPTGNPPSAEDEVRRAAGIPREEKDEKKGKGK